MAMPVFIVICNSVSGDFLKHMYNELRPSHNVLTGLPHLRGDFQYLRTFTVAITTQLPGVNLHAEWLLCSNL